MTSPTARRARHLTPAITTLALALGAAGCDLDDDALDSDSEGIYEAGGLNRFAWDDTVGQYVVNVCFQDEGESTVKYQIFQAVHTQWGRNSGLHFEFQQCPTTVPWDWVPIRFKYTNDYDDWGGVSAFGRGARLGGSPSAEIEIRLTPDRRMLRHTAVHEMGHTLGFIHEHERPNRPATTCVTGTKDDFVTEGGTYFTIYDEASIMNYCRDTDGNGVVDIEEGASWADRDNPALSPLDIVGVQRIYGSDVGNFAGGQLANSYACATGEECLTGDVDGDGIAETVIFQRNTGKVFVAYIDATGHYLPRTQSHNWFCVGNEVCKVADVNGDGRDDLVAFTRGNTGDVWVSLSTTYGFRPGVRWNDWFCVGNETCEVGDVNGDGSADLIAFTGGSAADVWVALSTGTPDSMYGAFAGSRRWSYNFCSGTKTCTVGDVNGDGRTDIISFTKSTSSGGAAGDVHVAMSLGASFGTPALFHGWMCLGQETCRVADVDGDGRADAVAFTGNGDAWVALSTGTRFDSSSIWGGWHCIAPEVCQLDDFTGDGAADLFAFDRATKRLWTAVTRPRP